MRRFASLALLLALTLTLAAPAAAAPRDLPTPEAPTAVAGSLWSWLVEKVEALFTSGDPAPLAPGNDPASPPIGSDDTQTATEEPDGGDPEVGGGADPWG